MTTTSGPGTSQLATSMLAAKAGPGPPSSRSAARPTAGTKAPSSTSTSDALPSTAIECGFVHVVAGLTSPRTQVQRGLLSGRTESRPVMLSAPADVQLEQYQGDQRYVPSSDLIGEASGCCPIRR